MHYSKPRARLRRLLYSIPIVGDGEQRGGGHCEAERVPLARQLSPAPPSPRALRPFFRARWLVPCCWRWGGERLLKRLHGFLGRHTAQWLGRWTYLLN